MSTGGWFPDPTGQHAQRWWDGARWTDTVADGGATGTDALRSGADPDDQSVDGRPGRSNRSRLIVIVVAAVVVGLGVAVVAVLASGDDDSSPGPASPSGGGAESTPCALVTTGELAAAVGSEFGDGEPIEVAGNAGCVWESTAPPGEGLSEPLKVEIFMFPLTTADRQAFDEVAAEAASEVLALGDLAVVRCDIEADAGLGCDAYGPLFAIQGDQYLGVELSNYVWPDDLTQDEVLDALTDVGSAALARMG